VSLKFNIFASFLSQIYVTIVGIVMVPMYLRYMGAEAYGLVGFFSTLVIVFGVLDLGLTPTMARETARFWGGATDALSYRRLVRALEGLFLCIALAGGAVMFAGAGYIAREWLHAAQLPTSEVQMAIELMAAIIVLRWMCGVYRGALTGSEQLVWLAGYGACVATVRFVGVLPVLSHFGATPRVFFSYQLAAAVLELLVLATRAYRSLPPVPRGESIPWSWAPLKLPLRFSLTVAFTSSVWVLVTQTDKVVLSTVLPLAAYGRFTLAVLVASGVSVISGPIGLALAPRLARLEAEGKQAGLTRVYRQATQLIAVATGTAAACAALYAEPLLRVWTGDGALAHEVAPLLVLYAIGNGFQVLTTQAYYLQFAKGDLRLHLGGSVAFVLLLIPTIVWAATHYAAMGAGYVWLAMNLLNFIIYVALVHRRFRPALHLTWLGRDVSIIAAAAVLTAYALTYAMPEAAGRWRQLGVLLVVGSLVLLAAGLASSAVMERVHAFWNPRRVPEKEEKCVAATK
jgi:O-antigen/teichoic acid export membrane protein